MKNESREDFLVDYIHHRIKIISPFGVVAKRIMDISARTGLFEDIKYTAPAPCAKPIEGLLGGAQIIGVNKIEIELDSFVGLSHKMFSEVVENLREKYIKLLEQEETQNEKE